MRVLFIFVYACAQVRLCASRHKASTPWRVLVVHDNVQDTPEAWGSVLRWHAHDTHMLFMCRRPDALRKLHFERDVPQLAMPPGLLEGSEFPEVLERLLRTSPHVMLDDAQRARLFKLTEGVPLAVQLAVRQLGLDAGSAVSEVLSALESSLATTIYAGCIARLTPSAQSVLRCLAHFEADDLPESLLEAVAAEVLGEGPGVANTTEGLCLGDLNPRPPCSGLNALTIFIDEPHPNASDIVILSCSPLVPLTLYPFHALPHHHPRILTWPSPRSS